MMTNLFTYTVIQPPTNVRATMLTPRSVKVTWTVSSSPDVTGYLISYTTDAEYIDMNDKSGNILASGNSGTLMNLEENTRYTITVQVITNNGNANSNEVSVTTYTDGK